MAWLRNGIYRAFLPMSLPSVHHGKNTGKLADVPTRGLLFFLVLKTWRASFKTSFLLYQIQNHLGDKVVVSYTSYKINISINTNITTIVSKYSSSNSPEHQLGHISQVSKSLVTLVSRLVLCCGQAKILQRNKVLN